MSRMDRLNELAKHKNFQPGPGRDEKNLAYWSARATENSDGADHRASDGPMVLPSTKQTVRDTAMRPKVARKVDAAMAGKGDHNNVGSKGDYMPGVRREV